MFESVFIRTYISYIHSRKTRSKNSSKSLTKTLFFFLCMYVWHVMYECMVCMYVCMIYYVCVYVCMLYVCVFVYG